MRLILPDASGVDVTRGLVAANPDIRVLILSASGEHRDVLEAYRMFAHDQGWSHRLREAVMTGLTAEAGVERVQSDTRARMMRATDPYLRERLHDLDDLANRLMRQLMGVEHAPKDQLPDNAILVDEGITGSMDMFPRTRGARAHEWIVQTGGSIGWGLPAAAGAAAALMAKLGE